jgi:16S rRNA G966 N2-methylase RsmD
MYLTPRIGRKQFDFAFLDPPYGKGILPSVLPSVAAVMKPGGAIICECPLEESLPESAGDFRIDREYRYGKIKITFYRAQEDGSDEA